MSTTNRVDFFILSDVFATRGIERVGSAMRTAMCGRPLVRFDAPLSIGPHPAETSVIESVEFQRRRLVVEFDDGIVLDSSLRWSGEWHLYRNEEQWTKPMSMARVIVEAGGRVAVCFGAASVETYRTPDLGRHPLRGGAGPDLRVVRPDLDVVIDRIASEVPGHSRVVDVLGDHHVVTGLGNVVRSEALWAMSLDPFTANAELDDEDWRDLLELARRFSSDAPDRLEVYGRLGQICRRCHGTIGCDEGDDGRLVYWCPGCQRTLENRSTRPLHDERSTDLRYLDEARSARRRVQIFDDLRDFG